jgi:phosphatidylglycerol lysyltransferase
MGQTQVKHRMKLQPGADETYFSVFALLWFIMTHMVTFFFLIKYASWENYILLLLFHTIFGVGITLGAHRYFSHNTFQGPVWFENFLAIAYTLSFVRAGHGLIGWVAAHRFHHVFVDQKYDPHSPRDGYWHAYAGHFINRRRDLWDFEQYKHYRPDLARKPFLVFLDKPATIISIQALWILLVVLVGGFTGKAAGFDGDRAFGFFVWLICARYVYTQFSHSMAATAAHGTWPFQWLKDTFNTKSDAKNNLFYWITTLGNETWHNVHHAFPKAANNGPYWYHWELDSFIMQTFNRLGIVRGLHLITKEQYESAKTSDALAIVNRNGRTLTLPDKLYTYYSHGLRMPLALRQKVERLAFDYGVSYDSYLATDPNREYFINPDESGVICFYTVGRYVNVIGGVIASKEEKSPLLSAFFEFCNANMLTVSFFGIAESELQLYESLNFQITKFGEDFRVDLPSLDWGGKGYSWVRRQVNFAQRHGVSAKELVRSEYDEATWSRLVTELMDLEDELLATKTQARPTSVFQGQLNVSNLERRRLFVAYNADGIAESFLVCNPMDGGKSWAVEIYRHRLNGINGSMAYLFHFAMNALKSEGHLEVSLCMNPAVRCDQPRPGDSAFCRKVMTFWDRHLNCVIDLRGVYHFKTRFRPKQTSIFLCVYPRVTLGSTVAFLISCGIIRVHPWRLLVNSIAMFRKWDVRKNLYRSTDLSNA